MRIQLDTGNKIIKVEEKVNFNELFEFLSKCLPNWQEYSLETGSVIYWHTPIHIDYWKPFPSYPWWQQPTPVVTYGVETTTVPDRMFSCVESRLNNSDEIGIVQKGIYCLEVTN